MRILADLHTKEVTDYIVSTNITTAASVLESTNLNIYFECDSSGLNEMDY